MARQTEVKVPDIGNFENVDVVEVLVSSGDRVQKEDPLISLESDKATLDVPAPLAGVVREVRVKVGDKVSEGDPILIVEVADEAEADGKAKRATDGAAERPAVEATSPEKQMERTAPKALRPEPAEELPEEQQETVTGAPAPGREQVDRGTEAQAAAPAAGYPPAPLSAPESQMPPPHAEAPREPEQAPPYASPAVRRFARELGVDLRQLQGSGPGQRIMKDDVQGHVKQALTDRQPAARAPGAGFSLPPLPEVDFAEFGPIERQPLSRIQRLSGPNLQRAWLHAPHVTQHGDADITALEAFRKGAVYEAKARGFKLTPVAFVMKACVTALKAFPTLNGSLDPDGEHIVLKRYYHFGIAVDTPEGLVVPVIRDVDRKGIFDLAAELAEVSQKARDRKLKPEQIQGASFSISSLGGIGGTYFTPIINVPQVAILGVSRATTRPVYQDGEWVPRLMLPLSLSYDHRAIDGATAARFVTHLESLLSDVRRVLL